MKKILTLIMFLGLFLSLPSVAKAEYAVSFSIGNTNTYPHHNKQMWDHSNDRNHDYRNRGHYAHGYYYWPPQPVYRTTIVKTYTPAPKPKDNPQQGQERLGISDILVLSKAGINDDTIIVKIAETHSVFDLRAEEIEWLRHEGVSARVINFMLQTGKK